MSRKNPSDRSCALYTQPSVSKTAAVSVKKHNAVYIRGHAVHVHTSQMLSNPEISIQNTVHQTLIMLKAKNSRDDKELVAEKWKSLRPLNLQFGLMLAHSARISYDGKLREITVSL